MINSLIPYTFLAGTKARAEEINANFEAIKKELNKKGKPNGYALLDNEGFIPAQNLNITPPPVSDFALFDTKVSDHILTGDDAIGWILQGSLVTMTYPDAVNKIKDLYTAGTDTTYREIACKRSTDGRYIADIEQKPAVDELFTKTGAVDLYIFDSANNQFYLPKTKWFQQFTLDTGLVNNYNEAGLPEISGKLQRVNGDCGTLSDKDAAEAAGAFSVITGTNPYAGTSAASRDIIDTLNFNASKSNPIYGKSNTVQPSSSNKLLYYKVGNKVTNEEMIDIGNLSADVSSVQSAAASKAEKDLSNCTKPYVKETYNNGSSWYRIWSDGFIEQGGETDVLTNNAIYTINLLKNFKTKKYTLLANAVAGNHWATSSARGNTYIKIHLSDYGNNSSSAFIWMARGY